MVLVCLPSDALLQHLPSYFGSSYLGRGGSLHGCSSKEQLLLLPLDKGYLLTAAPSDLECGVAPLGPPAPAQPFFIIGDWNAKVGSQDIAGGTGKFDLGAHKKKKAGQRLTEFCQENTLVIARTLFQKQK